MVWIYRYFYHFAPMFFNVFVKGNRFIKEVSGRYVDYAVGNRLHKLMVMRCESIVSGYLIRPSFNEAMDSRSRWFVGSSSKSTFAPESIICRAYILHALRRRARLPFGGFFSREHHSAEPAPYIGFKTRLE